MRVHISECMSCTVTKTKSTKFDSVNGEIRNTYNL